MSWIIQCETGHRCWTKDYMPVLQVDRERLIGGVVSELYFGGHMGLELGEITEEEETSKMEGMHHERSFVCWNMCLYS